MSKLPPDFIKSPAAAPAQRPRRTRKTSLVTAEPARDPREVVIRLTDDDHAALEEARQTLQRAGEDVTLGQMIQRVLAEWRSRALTATAPAAAPTPAPAPDGERILDRLRALAAAPLRTWRELGATLRRIRATSTIVIFGSRVPD
jgi:hypothetical protein